jgi:hypothetical protein
MTATTATTAATTSTPATATTTMIATAAKEDLADLVENHAPEFAWSEMSGLRSALVYDRRDAVSRQ